MLTINKTRSIVISSFLLLVSNVSCADNLASEILKITQDEHQLNNGQKLYESVCSSCHKKDLSGAMGFNLKDGEWIHGSSPSDIYNNIGKGFAKAGMPAFSAIYNDEQRKQITAYVLSKREGWNNLSYKIFQLPAEKNRSINELNGLNPVKKGIANQNIADFSMPESKEFGVIFEGDFYTYSDKDTVLYAHGVNPKFLMKLEIDGKEVPAQEEWSRYWPLKRGKQKLKLTMVTPQTPWPKWTHTDIKLIVANPDKTIKFFPASTRARTALNGTTLEIKAENSAIVQRKKVVDLPPYTISVGLPEKMNYGFNTRSCAVNGTWKGDMLNIGPNVNARGQDGSIVLGDWSFKFPQQLQTKSKASDCTFLKYTRGKTPAFYYTVDGVTLKLAATSDQKDTLTFTYNVLKNTSGTNTIRFNLPVSANSKVTSNDGVITNNTLTIDINKKAKFSINVLAQGEK